MSTSATAALLAAIAAYGSFLLYTAVAFGWRGLGVSPRIGVVRHRRSVRELLVQAGFEDMRPVEFAAVEVVLLAVASALGFAIYGGWLTAISVGAIVAALPIVNARSRRRSRLDRAREHWPRMLEELRLQVTTLGRSVPQALLHVGLEGPEEMRPAFLAMQREWHISTDLDRSLDVLKAQLADPTVDAVCETLLIAHDVGGSDVDRRLRALIDDRSADLQGRKDARARQAAVRFARWFVVIVPLGMAFVGLSIGDGRAAYATPSGQLLVLTAFVMMGACWLWAAQLLRLPEEQRVFQERRRIDAG